MRFTSTGLTTAIGFAISFGGIQPAYATPSFEASQAIILASADQHFGPRYAALAASSEDLSRSVTATCEAPDTLPQAQEAFHQAMDAWQGIAHFQVGPVTTLMRNFSMQYWPDTKNQGARHLGKILSSEDPNLLTYESLSHASIAVKGFPALERLLFSDRPLTGFRCATAEAIADYMTRQATGIYEEWPDFRDNGLATAGDVNDYYDEQLEALVDVLKALVEPVEALRDQKLLRPMATSVDKPMPRRAESWRSERSLRNLRINIDALAHLYRQLDAEHTLPSLLIKNGHQDLDSTIQQHFIQLQRQLHSLPDSMASVLKTPEGYQQLVNMAARLKNLSLALNEAMDALDIQLGFNSRDGD